MLVWRIEALKPVLLNPKDHGRFYNGDTYILLHTKKIPNRNKFTQDIYFWLGEKSTIDEQGGASIMVVELDDSLGGTAVQHREVRRALASRRRSACAVAAVVVMVAPQPSFPFAWTALVKRARARVWLAGAGPRDA